MQQQQHQQQLAVGVLLLLLLAGALGIPTCPLLDASGCCGQSCQVATCAALHVVGATLGAAVPSSGTTTSTSRSTTDSTLGWCNRTGWGDVYSSTFSKTALTSTAACKQYIATAAAAARTPAAATGAAAPPYCSWHGITCNTSALSSISCSSSPDATSHVVSSIVLINNRLQGNISSPGFVDALQQLHDCGLTKFMIGGASFGVVGTISPQFGRFERLQEFCIITTNITGTIPPELGGMRALESLMLQGNYLVGRIPAELGNLENLRVLNLGKNGFTDVGLAMHGPIPASFERLRRLEVLSLEANNFSGLLPANMCRNMTSLIAVSLRNNNFTGSADQFGSCNLVSLDLAENNFSGRMPQPPPGGSAWDSIVMLRLSNNRFVGHLPDLLLGEASVLSSIIVSGNQLSGTIPLSWTNLPWLVTVDVSSNDISGTLPEEFSFLSRLVTLTVRNNPKLMGTISPWFRLAVALQTLDLRNTNVNGSLPGITYAQRAAGVVPEDRLCGSEAAGLARVVNLQMVNIQATDMTAKCGEGDELRSIAEALPWYLTVDSFTWQVPPREPAFNNNTNMECPRITQTEFCLNNQLPQKFDQDAQPTWLVSPSYYHYLGCRCLPGYEPSYDWKPLPSGVCTVKRLICTPIDDDALDRGAIVGISFATSTVGVLLMGYCLYVSWYGRWGLPKLKRAYDDIKKRRDGAPKSGRVSIVVTDIESYSALMVAMPLVMGRSVSQHNNAIRKAAWTHYGFVIGQEGDSFLLAFREAVDAVAFCLQVQQSLMQVDWPPELLQHQKHLDCGAAGLAAPAPLGHTSRNNSSALLPSSCSTAPVTPLPSFGSAASAAAAAPAAAPSKRSQSHIVSAAATSLGPAGLSGLSFNIAAAGTGQGNRPDQAHRPSSESAGGGVEPGWEGRSSLGSSLWQQGPLRTMSGGSAQPFASSASLPQRKDRCSDAEGTKHSNSSRVWPAGRRLSMEGVDSLVSAATCATATPGSCVGLGSTAAAGPDADAAAAVEAVSAVSVLVPGLRVRMGVASGMLGDKERCQKCKVLEVAKVVSDAGSGGQVLLDSTTFGLVKDRLEELGQVGHSGYSRSSRVIGWGTPRGWLARKLKHNTRMSAEAVVLDMGLYSIPGFPCSHALDAGQLLPDAPADSSAAAAAAEPAAAATAAAGPGPPAAAAAIMPRAGLGPAAAAAAADGATGVAAASADASLAAANGRLPQVAQASWKRATAAVTAAAAAATAAASGAGTASAVAVAVAPVVTGCLRLYQVLAPRLLERAHLYGNKLQLKPGSALHDLPFFAAPGTTGASLLEQLLQQSPVLAGIRKRGSGSVMAGTAPGSRVLSGVSQHHHQQQQQACLDSSQHEGVCAEQALRAGGASDGAALQGRQSLKGALELAAVGSGQAADMRAIGSTASSRWLLPSSPVAMQARPLAAGGSGGGAAAADLAASTTYVFCSVILPGKARLALEPSVAAQVSAIASRVLRQCLLAFTNHVSAKAAETDEGGGSGCLEACGYMCREMAGDMKYLMVFHRPRLALEWCLLVQEAMLWQDWPSAVLDRPGRLEHTTTGIPGAAVAAVLAASAATEQDNHTHPLFRGPRIKMGVDCGAPQAVCPDHLGRADYHSNNINMAARYEAVCAQGGQIVCEAGLAAAVVAEWAELASPATAEGAAAAATAAAAERGVGSDAEQQQLQHKLPGPAAATPFAKQEQQQLQAQEDAPCRSGSLFGQQHQQLQPLLSPAGTDSSAGTEELSFQNPVLLAAAAAEARGALDAEAGGPAELAAAQPATAAAVAQNGFSVQAGGRAQSAGLPIPLLRTASPTSTGSLGSSAVLASSAPSRPAGCKSALKQQQQQGWAGGLPGPSAAGRAPSPEAPSFHGWGGGAAAAAAAAAAAGASAPPGSMVSVAPTRWGSSAPHGTAAAGAATGPAPGQAPSMHGRHSGGVAAAGISKLVKGCVAGGAGAVAVAVHMAPTPTQLPCVCCVSPLPSERYAVEVHQVGRFVVKGQPSPVEIVEVVLEHLAARRFLLPEAPSKSAKGRLLEPLSAKCALVPSVALPALALRYCQQHAQREATAAAAAAAELETRSKAAGRLGNAPVAGGGRVNRSGSLSSALRQRSMPLSMLASRTVSSLSGGGSGTSGVWVGARVTARQGSWVARTFSLGSGSAGSSGASSPRATSMQLHSLRPRDSVPEDAAQEQEGAV